MGGVLAEAMRDVTYRVAPVDRRQALQMIGELRASSVFGGVRGRPACDIDDLADVMITISEFAYYRRAEVSEIDINPLLLRARGLGAIAADALVVLR
jgi:hypothetical protein